MLTISKRTNTRKSETSKKYKFVSNSLKHLSLSSSLDLIQKSKTDKQTNNKSRFNKQTLKPSKSPKTENRKC